MPHRLVARCELFDESGEPAGAEALLVRTMGIGIAACWWSAQYSALAPDRQRVEVNRYTSTDAFCTSCHTMALVADDPHFRQSAHRSNAAGVHAELRRLPHPQDQLVRRNLRACHLGHPRHHRREHQQLRRSRILGEARRIELAHEVRDEMRAQDSVTCRSCHDRRAIQPTSSAAKPRTL